MNLVTLENKCIYSEDNSTCFKYSNMCICNVHYLVNINHTFRKRFRIKYQLDTEGAIAILELSPYFPISSC